ncbi:hypothetical protein JKF87_13655 [Brevundimonas nasdae]|jgi:hypothetical protein|uniref:Uncharacterized protein n=1 Tax=Brevundimonas nasdae TaxID=172043 RepID=A0ABX8TMM7_9CAUL|nr:hypothetical protein [Brevundimonas nasdae]MBK6026108.1 hypothetical protein [Brevundimonas nasdae]QYC11055.1 hypothetical protein KWG56_03325 [Brevundimonas nasdae]QYC13842.1 hypothetical protein KWG63_16880 [Brevundimonas nasdae]
MGEQYRELAAIWLSRSFAAPTVEIAEAYVELAAIYEALASLALRLDGLARRA